MVATACASRPDAFAGWRIVFCAFLINNIVLGCAYGGYGISVVAISETFSVGRAVASLPMSLIILATTMIAPFLSAVFKRLTIRRTIVFGLLLACAGYLILAFTTDWRVMLATYLFLVGPGVASSGFLPKNVLVANWFIRSQGKALGIVNMSVFIMLVPVVASRVLESVGLDGVYLLLAGLTAAALAPALFLVDRPADLGQQPLADPDPIDLAVLDAPTLTSRQLLAKPPFWILVCAIGMLMSAGTVKIAHMVPLLIEQGHPLAQASLLLAVTGAAGVVGSMFFGFLADKIGGAWALVPNGLLQAATWSLLLLPLSMPILIVDAVAMGLCGAGIVAAQGVMFSHFFGVRNFALVIGLSSVATMPFLVGMAPFVGYLRDQSGSYHLPTTVLVVASAASALLFFLLAVMPSGRVAQNAPA